MRLAPALLLTVAVAAFPALGGTPDPAVIDDLLVQAVRLHDAGDYGGAIAVYRRVLDLDPANVEARYEMAYSHFSNEDYAAAVEGLDRIASAPEIAPPGTWLLLGASRAMLGHWALAERAFRRGLDLRPDDEDLRFHLGLSLAAQNRFDSAIESFQDFLRLAPYRADGWRALGDALLESGAKGRAFAAYARSLTLEESTPASSATARRMWNMIFDDLGSPVDGSIQIRVTERTLHAPTNAAEASGMGLLAVLRGQRPWIDESDAAFFAYALDTILELVASLQDRHAGAAFWEPYLLDYFDAMRDGGHIEALAYDIRSAAGDPDAFAWRQRNEAKHDAFRRSSQRWAVNWSAVGPTERVR